MPETRAHKTETSRITGWVTAAFAALVPLVFWQGLRDYTLAPKLLILQIAVVLLLIAWLADSRRSFSIPALGLPALAYLLLNIVSLAGASAPVAGLLEGTKILSGFLVFLVIANRLAQRQITGILAALIAASIPISLLGITQYMGWFPFRIPSAGLPSATLGYRNIAAMYLIQTIPLGLSLLATARSGRLAWATSLAGMLMVVFLLYTRTRGAWLGLAVGTLLTLLLLVRTGVSPGEVLKKNRTRISVACGLIILLGLLSPGAPKRGPQSIDEKKTGLSTALSSVLQPGGDRGRLVMWQHTLSMIVDHPFMGVGLGNWAVHYLRYDRGDRTTFESAPERPHNDLLWICSETGLLGVLCYLWFLVIGFRTAAKHVRSTDTHARWIAAGCLASLVAIVVHGCFSFPRERITPTLLFWLSAGFLAVLDKPFHRRMDHPIITRAVIGLLLLVAVLQILFTGRIIQFETAMYRAVQAEQNNRWEQTAAETRQALQAGAFHPEAVHLRGYALNALGRFAESTRLYTSGLRRRPYDIQMLNGMAVAAQNTRAFGAAEQHYREALHLVPNSPDIHYNLAGLYRQMGKPRQAAAEFERVLQLEDPSLELYYMLGNTYVLASMEQAAAKAYLRALRLSPHSAGSHFEIMENLFLRHRQPQILQVAYRTFLENWEGAPQHLEIARKRLNQLSSNRPY